MKLSTNVIAGGITGAIIGGIVSNRIANVLIPDVKTDTVTCEYVRHNGTSIVGYVFYQGTSIKTMTGQAILPETDAIPKYLVGRSYQIPDSTLIWTFPTKGVAGLP